MMGVMKEEIIAMSLCLYNLAGMVVFVPSLDRQSLELGRTVSLHAGGQNSRLALLGDF